MSPCSHHASYMMDHMTWFFRLQPNSYSVLRFWLNFFICGKKTTRRLLLCNGLAEILKETPNEMHAGSTVWVVMMFFIIRVQAWALSLWLQQQRQLWSVQVWLLSLNTQLNKCHSRGTWCIQMIVQLDEIGLEFRLCFETEKKRSFF